MKFVTLSLLISTSAFATGNHFKMKVIPLNSPVSEAAIIFKLEPPNGMTFNDVNARIKNQTKPPFRERIKDYPVEKSGNQILLKLPTRDYPVDTYEIFVYTKNDNRKMWEFWKKAPPVALGKANFEVKTHQIVVDGDPQPPHPGEAGKETLLGIDSDGDQVRDDIEILINETFMTRSSRLAAKQIAINLHRGLMLKDDKEKSILETQNRFKSFDCLDWVLGKNSRIEIDQLNFNFFNTKQRILAKDKISENFHGYGLAEEMEDDGPEDGKLYCTFSNPEKN